MASQSELKELVEEVRKLREELARERAARKAERESRTPTVYRGSTDPNFCSCGRGKYMDATSCEECGRGWENDTR